MKDFYLSDGDLDTRTGDLRLVDGIDRVRQQLEIKLGLWREEWFLDLNFGTPYLQRVLIPSVSLTPARDALRVAAMEVADVEDVRLSLTLNKQHRKLDVRMVVKSTFGQIETGATYG